ncbi:hypothetical protein FSP39_020202, partial [Pinctada imbricata]
GRLYCNATYDTVRCWGVTLAGTRAYGDCPKSLPQSAMFSPDGYSFKDCTKNGTWWTYPSTGKQWTNYTTCIQDKLVRANTLLYVYISGFAVSLVLLLISLIIFSIFRQLKCTRVSMHKHLFASYIVNAVLWIPYYTTLMDVQIVERNPVWCRVLHVITQYATICNYAWMFCEGLYLHSIIAFAFTNQKRLLIICCVIGWANGRSKSAPIIHGSRWFICSLLCLMYLKISILKHHIIQMLNFLIDNIFVVFGGKVFQQIVGIPMGTNGAPLLADTFRYSY